MEKAMAPTLVLLPGKSHGRRSLEGCSPWGRWGSDKTERLHFHFSLSCIGERNGNPLQCSCLENPRDGGAWWAAVSGVAQSQTRLKRLSSSRVNYFANKGPSSQGYGFSCGHVWIWELDYEEGWAPKNWCFWTVVLEKTPESPLECKEIQPVHSEGDQPWDFFGGNDAKAETPVLWPHMRRVDSLEKTLMLGGTGGRRRRGRQRMRWLNGITNSTEVESKWTPGVGDGQGGLACCDSWGRKESDMTEWLNWTESALNNGKSFSVL